MLEAPAVGPLHLQRLDHRQQAVQPDQPDIACFGEDFSNWR